MDEYNCFYFLSAPASRLLEYVRGTSGNSPIHPLTSIYMYIRDLIDYLVN